MGVDPARTVIAPRAFRRARATCRLVVVVADAVSIELCSVPSRLRTPSRRVGPPAPLSPSPPAAVVARRLLAGSGPGQVSGALLHHLVPAVPGLPARQRWVLSQCAPSILPEEAVYVLAQDPAIRQSVTAHCLWIISRFRIRIRIRLCLDWLSQSCWPWTGSFFKLRIQGLPNPHPQPTPATWLRVT
jgi:hypothetical protein